MTRLEFTLLNVGLGWVGIVASPIGLRRIILPQGSKDEVLRQVEGWDYVAEGCESAFFGNLTERLERYFEGEPVDFSDKLDMDGATGFQQSVWQVTRTIPYGETRSYGWVASQLGLPRAARAVGQALGRNPLPIVIPCHRVIASDGNLGGFSGGIKMKEHLLRLENVCL